MNAKVLGLLLAIAAVGLLATGSAAAIQSENPEYEKCYIDVCSISDQVLDSTTDSVTEFSENPRDEKCYIDVCSVSAQPLESATDFGVAELSVAPQDEKCYIDVC